MPSLLDFTPLYQETVETIRDRLDADVNAGLSPEDDAWVDTTVGGFYWDLTQVVILELERLWDAVSIELPAAAFIHYAWGDYLDEHGVVLGVERKAAAQAGGEVQIVAPDGTAILAGTEVAVPLDDPAADDIAFQTTEDRVVTPLPAPTGLGATATTGGTLAAGTYEWVVTAVNVNGETVASAAASAVVGGGGTNAADLAWSAVVPPAGGEEVTGYRVYRGPAGGPYGLVGTAAGTAFTDTGTATGADAPEENTSGGSVRAPILAELPGSLWNVAADSIRLLMTPIAQVAEVTNPEATTGGADVETDEAYQQRLILELTAEVGGGTVADYKRWFLARPGVGHVTVEPIWSGPGTVRVTVTDLNNDPLSAGAVTELQEWIDPVPGEGRGAAPIGHTVTVATPASLAVDLAATIAFNAGYSLDGSAGTQASRDAIEDAYSDFIRALGPGDDVLYNRALAAILAVEGVLDISALTLNGGAGDVAVSTTQSAAVGSVALS